jgi:hypothetical protein
MGASAHGGRPIDDAGLASSLGGGDGALEIVRSRALNGTVTIDPVTLQVAARLQRRQAGADPAT